MGEGAAAMTREEAMMWLRTNGVAPRRQNGQIILDEVPPGVRVPGGLTAALRDVPDDLLASAVMPDGATTSPAHAVDEGMTLSALMKKKFPPRREFVPGIIVQGVTLFAAKAKIGKTWFVLAISLALALDGK